MGFILGEVFLKKSFGDTEEDNDEEDDETLGFGALVTCELAVIHLRVRICFDVVVNEIFRRLCSSRASSERGGTTFCGEDRGIPDEVGK